MKPKAFRIIITLALCLILLPAALAAEEHTCTEGEWEDHQCDECGNLLTDLCTDTDGDHFCDLCWCPITDACVDQDQDEYCDVCWGHMIQHCIDTDNNHSCDVCWRVLSTCCDENKNHLCDICGSVFWADENGDGICDGCDAILTHVTAEHKNIYYHTKNGATVADIAIEATVQSYAEDKGFPAGTVSVRWTDESGKSYSSVEKALTFGMTAVTIEHPSLPIEALKKGGRVIFTPYDAGFTPAENGCIIEHDLPRLQIDSDSEYTVNGVTGNILYLVPGTKVTVVQQPGLTDGWEWVFEEGSAVPEITVNGLTSTFLMPEEDVDMHAAWRCGVCTDADRDNRCDVCGYYVEDPIYVGGVAVPDGWYLSNDGTVTHTAPKGGWAHYKSDVLTLSAYEYTGPGLAITYENETDYALIFSATDLEIHVESPSTMVGTTEGGDGIVSCGDLSFTGDLLTLTVSGSGVCAVEGRITLETANLQLDTGAEGINSSGNVTVYNSTATLLCNGSGIYICAGDLTLENSTLDITAGLTGAHLCAGSMECCGSELRISGTAGALFVRSGLKVDENLTVQLPESGIVTEQTAAAEDGTEYTYYTIADPDGKDALSIVVGEFRPSAGYTDIKADAWYRDAVDYALAHELLDGVDTTLFAPDGAADRAAFVHALWKAAGTPVVNYLMTFSDVEQDAQYAEAVRWAASEGITTGFPDGTFRPGQTITRQEMAAFLYRYEQNRGGGFTGTWMFLLNCTDRADVAEWAYEPMCWLNMKGVLNGDGTGALNPRKTATRAEMAQMLMNYLNSDNT